MSGASQAESRIDNIRIIVRAHAPDEFRTVFEMMESGNLDVAKVGLVADPNGSGEAVTWWKVGNITLTGDFIQALNDRWISLQGGEDGVLPYVCLLFAKNLPRIPEVVPVPIGERGTGPVVVVHMPDFNCAVASV